jgi:hypothetical protein
VARHSHYSTICGWAWTRTGRAFISVDPSGAPQCDKCWAWAVARSSTRPPGPSSAASSSSSSDGERSSSG